MNANELGVNLKHTSGPAIENLENHWVGKEKQRYDFVLKYMGGNTTRKGYSVHKFEDSHGHKFLTYHDSAPGKIQIDGQNEEMKDLIEGDCFTCKATVLRHAINDFNVSVPFKETVLNRIKFGVYLGRKENE